MDGGLFPYANLLAIPLSLGFSTLGGLINAGPRWRRGLGVGVALLTALPPFIIAPEVSSLRFIAALGLVCAIFRSLDLFRESHVFTPAQRIWHMLAVFDARRVTFGPRRFDSRGVLLAALFAILTAGGGALVLLVAPMAKGGVEWLLRWLGGALLVYASFDALVHAITAAYRLIGIEIPKAHDNPILSRSIKEFWSQRWNRVVHAMLRDHCHLPLVRRGHPTLGVIAAFSASALLHGWLIVAAGSYAMAALMVTFFLLQGFLMVIEGPLGVRNWSAPRARAWTIASILVCSPLFVEPMLRAFLWRS